MLLDGRCRFINNVEVGEGRVETHMNEGDRFFAPQSAVLYEFIERSRGALLDDPDEGKKGIMLDFPKPRVSVDSLEESVKNGLSLRLAEYLFYRIEMSAKERVKNCIKTGMSSDSKLAQVRAKSRREELQSKSEDQIELEASRRVNDLWNDAVEHQAARY
jgi:hypothetical protein